MRIVTVTPAMATSFLEKNVRTRSLSEALVKRLESDMLEGRWIINGESLKFDKIAKTPDTDI